MTESRKNTIAEAIKQEKTRLGSYARVATKVGVSEGTLSNMHNGKNWDLIKDALWLKVEKELDTDSGDWKIAETINFKRVWKTCEDAKKKKMFIMISDTGGKGKSEPLKSYWKDNTTNNVFYIRCREWAKREFLEELCSVLGIEIEKPTISIDKLGMLVVNFFLKRSSNAPQLIIDEIDKLKDPALRWIIVLYNELEERMSVIAAGGPHLRERIRKGVKLKRLGYDEIDSRFGRNILHIIGATAKCVEKICLANGIEDTESINEITKCLSFFPEEIELGDGQFRMVKMTNDIRRVRRSIENKLLKTA